MGGLLSKRRYKAAAVRAGSAALRALTRPQGEAKDGGGHAAG
jgi:hypothetical protein